MAAFYIFDAPVGPIGILEDGCAVTGVWFGSNPPPDAERKETEISRCAALQLREYFAGKRRVFTVPLAPAGTPFQRCVWSRLLTIPYGETRSYGDVARGIGNTRACRAVGMANHRNPVPIFIPCHRVVGADGSLTGYGGGIRIKETLLRLEGIPVTDGKIGKGSTSC